MNTQIEKLYFKLLKLTFVPKIWYLVSYINRRYRLLKLSFLLLKFDSF